MFRRRSESEVLNWARETSQRAWAVDPAAAQGALRDPAAAVAEWKERGLFSELGPVELLLNVERVPAYDPPSRSELRNRIRSDIVRAAQAVVLSGPPVGNTGATFTVHTANLTFHGQAKELLSICCHAYLRDFDGFTQEALEVVHEIGSGKLFGRMWQICEGVIVKASPRRTGLGKSAGAETLDEDEDDIGGDYCCAEFQGSAFDQWGMAAFQQVLVNVHSTGLTWRLTRCDLALDHCPFTPKVLFDAAMAGNVRTYADLDTLDWREKPRGAEKGSTCALGKRGSSHYLRCYDKRGFTRFELECRGSRANVLGLQLVNFPIEEWGYIALGTVRAWIDFVDRDTSVNVSRRKLLPFWTEFVQGVEKMKVKLTPAASAFVETQNIVADKVDRTMRRVRSSLVSLCLSLGEENFDIFVAATKAAAAQPAGNDVRLSIAQARGQRWAGVLREAEEILGCSREDLARRGLKGWQCGWSSVFQ